MCGISGSIDTDEAEAYARTVRLNAFQDHRGPDHSATATVGSMTIGNTRLPIQDLSSGANQPLVSADGQYICVFNGEIYNFRELRRQYALPVLSDSDGAVIPPLWQLMGAECLPLLRGMWALAVIDVMKTTLTLARDPFGIKPLYIRTFPEGGIAFASELRALARLHPKPALDAQAFSGYLRFGGVDPDVAPCVGVAPLPPNRWLEFAAPLPNGTVRSVSGGPVLLGPEPLTQPTEGTPWDALLDSVDRHLMADVSTALLLSSGLDSSFLACAAQRRGHSLDCFTVKLPGHSDESEEAAITARFYGHRHRNVAAELTPDDISTFFDAMQRPTIDGLNTFLVSKAIAKAGYRVAVSGLGGDEAVAGYPHMRYYPLLRAVRLLDHVKLGEPISKLSHNGKLSRLLSSEGPRNANAFNALFREILPADIISRLLGSLPDPVPESGETTLRSLINEEVANYLQRILLPDSDSFSMRWSLELRVPFLDIPYFRTAATSARPFRGKSDLASAAHDERITALRRRPKQGFSLPMAEWMSSGPLVDAVLDARRPNAPIWEFMDRDQALHYMDCGTPRRWADTWTFAALNGWLSSYSSDKTA